MLTWVKILVIIVIGINQTGTNRKTPSCGLHLAATAFLRVMHTLNDKRTVSLVSHATYFAYHGSVSSAPIVIRSPIAPRYGHGCHLAPLSIQQ